MKIKEITSDAIIFDNGNMIISDYIPECCEYNYADFEQLDDLGRNYDFDENLKFEVVDDSGFSFGDSRRMFYIPCYSEQSGFYSSDIDIYYNDDKVLSVCGEIVG